jgi:hypothetical protein
MKVQLLITLSIIIFLFVCRENAKAQKQTHDSMIHTPVWATLSLGGGSFGFTSDASLNVDIHNYLLSVEALIATTGSAGESFATSDFTDFGSYRFGIGRIFLDKSNGKFLIAASTGISISTISYHYISGGFLFGSSSVNTVNTIGIPLDFKIIIPTRSALGLDFGFKLDFNKEKTFIAVMCGMRIGRIMPKK